MDFKIGKTHDGAKLFDYLRGELGISHSLLCSLKAENGIFVNGVPVTVRYILASNDILTLELSDKTSSDAEPCDLPLDIIYEDEFFLAVDKPPYMPTHESHLHRGDTLANAAAWLFLCRGIPFVFRAPSRLDCDTSGVVILAKNKFAAERLSTLIKDGQYKKTYIAVCHGQVPQSGKITGYIRRIDDSLIIRASYGSGSGSEYAETDFFAEKIGEKMSVVRCNPITGRTHQLRVHLSSIGHPIVGDDLYGGEKIIARQALHAKTAQFVHPFYKTEITITAPLPKDMQELADGI